MNESVAQVLVTNMKNSIIKCLENKNQRVYEIMLSIYNRYCEEEKAGNDYIFDMNNQSDFLCLVQGGMTFQEVKKLCVCRYVSLKDNRTYVIWNTEQIVKVITSQLDEIVPCIIKYPFVDEYKLIYQMFITEVMEQMGL